MKLHARKHFLALALVAGLGGTAMAQQGGAAPAASAAAGHQGPHGMVDPARHAERIARRLADLKQKLQLAPQQEGAWTSFVAAMQPTPKQRPDREALARMTTPDRLDHLRALRTQRNADMDRRAEAAKAFYAQLNAEQKKTFDDETARMFQGGGRGMHRHHG